MLTDFTITLPAGEDLSGQQFRWVRLVDGKIYAVVPYFTVDEDGHVHNTDPDTHPAFVGVLQNDPGLGHAGEVILGGLTKVVAEEAFTFADATATQGCVVLMPGNDGRAYPVNMLGGDHFGYALSEASAAGVVVRMLLWPTS